MGEHREGKMLRSAIYARYSSDNQRHESIETQYRICEDYCRQKGYLVVKHYKDEAKTGTTTAKRDGFNAMLSEAGRDVWDVLVVYTLDRTARQELDYYLYKQELIDSGVKYEYATESFDPSTADGQFFEGIQVAQAAWYSRKLSVRVKDGKETNAKAQLFQGGMPPLGYDVTPDHKFIINAGEAEAVRMIFSLYNKNYSLKSIVDALNAAGYRTKAGKVFGRNSIYDIIANPKYIGTYIFRRALKRGRKTNTHRANPDAVVYKNTLPAIISQADWLRAQGRKKTCRNIGTSNKHNYVFSGLVQCGCCGHKMTGESTGRAQYRYYWYQCTEQINKGVGACASKKIKQSELEDAVIDGILKGVTIKNLCALIQGTEEAYSNLAGKCTESLGALQAQKAGLEKRLNNLYAILEAGSADEFDLSRLADLKNQIRTINQKILAQRDYQPVKLTKDEILNAWEDFKKFAKEKDDPKMIRTVLRNLISSVVVYPDKILVKIALCDSKRMVAPE